LHQLLEQQIDSPLDDGSEVAVRIGMAHQVARQLELILQGKAGGKLHAIALRRKRLEAVLAAAPRGSEGRACPRF
jgi:hypothetical protein